MCTIYNTYDIRVLMKYTYKQMLLISSKLRANSVYILLLYWILYQTGFVSHTQ